MPVDPQLLDRVLHTPESRDVSTSPIVTAIILQDPATAADLVPPLDQIDTIQAKNARRILCLFGPNAVAHLVKALLGAGVNARKEGVEILWAMLLGESAASVRDTLTRVAGDLAVLLDDKRAMPDRMPDYIERDFEGRICDLTFIVLQQLIDANYDQSLFRSLDKHGRDDEIARLKRSGFGLRIA